MIIQKIKVNLKRASFVCLLLHFAVGIQAHWNSFVINYNKELYGRGTQTWSISSYDRDRVYFANKNGLVHFNGYDWSLYTLHNHKDARSLLVSKTKDRIYVGGESEFGYFKPHHTGEMYYYHLSEDFLNSNNLGGVFWGIHEVDNLVYFVSDHYLIKYLENEFIPIFSDQKIDCSGMFNGVLYVGTVDGIRMLIGNSLFELPGGDALKGKTIRTIVTFEQGMLIATAFDGLYYYQDGQLDKYETGIEGFLRENEIFSMAVSSNYIAVGTIQRGAVLIDRSSGKILFYNEHNGLHNDTVLSVEFDEYENLWLGLDNGIDYLPLHNPITNLYTYPHFRGAGYTVLERAGFLYLGTNRGLFYCSYPVSFTENPLNLHLLPELSGQVWHLEEVGDEIFCLHDKGVFVIDRKHQVRKVPGIRGALTAFKHSRDKNKYWIGTYDGLFLLEKVQGEWRVNKRLEEVTAWMKNVAFESADVFWVRLVNSGFMRVELDSEQNTPKRILRFTLPDGFKSYDDLYLHKINEQIYFTSPEGFFEYDPYKGELVVSHVFDGILQSGVTYKYIKQYESLLYALAPGLIQVALFDEKGEYVSTQSYPFNDSQIDFINFYEQITILTDGTAIIPNEKGFALLENVPYHLPVGNLFINKVVQTYPRDTLLYVDSYHSSPEELVIPYTGNALRFEYALRSFIPYHDVQYRFRLYPDKTWSDYTFNHTKEYSNLGEGKYTFEVEARTGSGHTEYTQFSFTILPPWYRTFYAYLSYLILSVVGFVFLYRLEDARIEKRKRKEIEEKENELLRKEQDFIKEDLKKEQKIIELKNEKLEQDLRYKGQEMANLMINLSRKNEALFSIKQELYKVINDMKGESYARHKRMLLALNNSIDVNMQSDDVLKRFEEQFNLVHNNFIKKISDKHPDLTLSERKMCAYLKMNLSSKEIAPLLNLSVRGVETLRYRLRKKIGLEREDSLTEYLNSFN